MTIEAPTMSINSSWQPVKEAFLDWLADREHLLSPGLVPEPTIKVLIFLALLDADKECTYEDLHAIFAAKRVIDGRVPDNTLRTSVLNLGKTLEKFDHPLELQAFRGRFRLVKNRQRSDTITFVDMHQQMVRTLIENIAISLVKKAVLPFYGLYFLERSARWWERYSSREAETRMEYEVGAWEALGVKQRIAQAQTGDCICIVGLAPGEGLAEIELVRRILQIDPNVKVHYLAIDCSPRLLRGHIALLKESLVLEIQSERLLCAGVIADIFKGMHNELHKVRSEFKAVGAINVENDYLPVDSPMLVTFLGNCIGNNQQDLETEIFSIVHSTFENRPLEFLVGASVMRATPDEYKRNWDDFLLQTPLHLLNTNKLLVSARQADANEAPEFMLPEDNAQHSARCPEVVPEAYTARHHIVGQIYRFYYKLSFDLHLSASLGQELRPLPKGTLILLYSIIKYDIASLVAGIKKAGLFQVAYDNNYHQVIETPNGIREYAVFSAYVEDVHNENKGSTG